MITVLSGSMQVTVGHQQTWRIDGGGFLILPAGTHRYAFCDEECMSMRLRFKHDSNTVRHGQIAAPALQLLQDLHDISRYPQSNPQTCLLLLNALLCELDAPSLSPLRNQDLNRSQAFAIWLKQALKGESNINQGAQELGLSPDHFTRLFKKQYGQTPKACIMQRRFEEAASLLMEEDISTRELARRVGVNDSALFCKQFKQRFGCSPGQYREHRTQND